MTLASVQVKDIGLRSLSIVLGGETLGLGVTMHDLRREDMYPSFNDWL